MQRDWSTSKYYVSLPVKRTKIVQRHDVDDNGCEIVDLKSNNGSKKGVAR